MKNVIEVRANSIYTTEPGKLSAMMELIIIHTDGKQYDVKGNQIVTKGIIRETRFTVSEKNLDDMIADLQKWKANMVTLQQNCRVMNEIVEKLNAKPADENS